MSYTVFALKWRPKNFDELIGQAHVVATLKNAIKTNRLAHAYLFAGPRGVGKTSAARILAKSLNCKEGPTLNPCGKCSTCIEISEGRSMDVIEIDGASNRGIDEIRALRENAKFAPVSAKFKVYIIDEVHQITPDGFNALLKTLEEPPEYIKFIFATTHPHKVIPTILSRCQRFDFRRIPVMETIAQLEKIVREEKIEIDREVLFALAKSSDGSLRDAESVLDQLVSFTKGKISLSDVVSVLGIVEQEALFALTDRIIQKDPKGALELFNRIIDDGKDISVFLTNLIEHFRNLMIAKITRGDTKLIDLPEDICQGLLKQSSAFTMEEIFSAFNILVMTQEMAKRLDSLRIPMEISLIRLSHDKKGEAAPKIMQDYTSPKKEAPAVKPVIAEHKPEKPAKKIEEEPVDPNPSASISLDAIKDIWQNVINGLSAIKMSVATYLNEGQPLKVQGSVLTVSFPKNYSLHKEALDTKENKKIIEDKLSGLLNAALRVHFVLSKEEKTADNAEHHSSIKSALEMFGGRVIKEE